MPKKPEGAVKAVKPPAVKPEDKRLREVRPIYKHNTSGIIPLPIKWIKDLGWCPGDCKVLLTKNNNGTITIEKARKEGDK